MGQQCIPAWLSDIFINGNSNITFNNNKATSYGGAVYAAFPNNMFHDSSFVTFSNSKTARDGGAVFAESSTIMFHGNSTVIFNKNYAVDDTGRGGAIFMVHCSIMLNRNSSVMFTNNIVITGGAVYVDFHDILFLLLPSEQTWPWNVHALERSQDDGIMSFNNHSSVKFVNNTATRTGGALVIHNGFAIASAFFTGNSAVTFSNNTAKQLRWSNIQCILKILY